MMKWLVRIASGVLIAFLLLTMFRVEGHSIKASLLAILAVLTFAYWFEGIDVSKFWGDDEDDGQGPLRLT